MPAPAYSHTLSCLTVNLLVQDVAACTRFQTEVLGAEIVYADVDFAVYRGYGAEWAVHADHTYDAHPLFPLLAAAGSKRGPGAELRLHGCDPDRAEASARSLGFTVISSATTKPHGLREAYLLDAGGYLWVPDVPA